MLPPMSLSQRCQSLIPAELLDPYEMGKLPPTPPIFRRKPLADPLSTLSKRPRSSMWSLVVHEPHPKIQVRKFKASLPASEVYMMGTLTKRQAFADGPFDGDGWRGNNVAKLARKSILDFEMARHQGYIRKEYAAKCREKAHTWRKEKTSRPQRASINPRSTIQFSISEGRSPKTVFFQ
eukprot:GEMP01090695.1.p1 GENE.GEMP01090695.1~~GEMP01090695.1.p1  ORF type:complete len:179 (+),score=26.81 GEMP01090695.1:115-651(+)